MPGQQPPHHMEIVIENEPYRSSSTSPSPAYLRTSPVSGQQPPLVSSNNAFYYATLPRGRVSAASDPLDGAPTTTSVRRVDKSGLLEIAELEPPRHLPGADGHGTLSRRLERSGLLEAVPEVPDQCHPRLASDELLAAAATARSMVERQQHLLGAETDVVESALLRRRAFAAAAATTELPETSGERSSEAECVTRSSGPRVKFAEPAVAEPEEAKEPASRKPSVVDCLGRLSPRQRERHVPMTLSNIPDVIEAHGSPASTTSAATQQQQAATTNGEAPEGERAEAEGCEHTAIESVEEARVAYKSAQTAAPGGTATPSTKLSHDNIQAVHVIILSEQL